MNFISDLSDLNWIRELDPQFSVALDAKETGTTVWVCFLCTFKELRDKLESVGYGLGCIDINLAKEGYDWRELELLEEFDADLMGVPYEYRYILDTVGKT